MSEFLECQNCGRRFFAENTECPYCGGEQEERERLREAQRLTSRLGSAPYDSAGMFPIMFASFQMLLLAIAVLALFAIGRATVAPQRYALALEAAGALGVAIGLWRCKRWARYGAVLFILANAAVGFLSLLQRGGVHALAWGPGPLALLVFLVPFCTKQARERYDR